jgi:ubiquinone/menaquinone biosynthesis C-methylase UbiE
MATAAPASQDKAKEVAFFDRFAAADDYDVFLPAAKTRIIDAFVRLSALPPGARVADIGCGSGAFTTLLAERGYRATGLDISPKLIALARRKFPDIEFIEGDAEKLPFDDGSFDGVLLSGLIHHFPDQRRLAAEVFRVLGPGGRFVAFDPNRLNPLFWLYRDPSSPFYSRVGVTENERPLLAWQAAKAFGEAGFEVRTEYLAGLPYRFVQSAAVRTLLPIYNAVDRWIFTLPPLAPLSPFVLTAGEKRKGPG